jgi:sarcosine oxidase/L-pipecolate oxidase
MAQIKKDSAIIVVGAGVFGLSTALHLARRGYTNVTIIDKQPYKRSLYSYDNGCDAASAGKTSCDGHLRRLCRNGPCL